MKHALRLPRLAIAPLEHGKFVILQTHHHHDVLPLCLVASGLLDKSLERDRYCQPAGHHGGRFAPQAALYYPRFRMTSYICIAGLHIPRM